MLNRLLDNVASERLQAVALIFDDQTYTYADLSSLTQRLAAGLLALGIRSGDRVAFLLPNSLEIVLCYYACLKVGAIAVPLNIRFTAQLLKYVIDHCGARILISEPQLFAEIEKVRPTLGVENYYLTVHESRFAGTRAFADLLVAAPGIAEPTAFSETTAAAIYYTSGTTGPPKAVIHSHGSLASATRNQIEQIQISASDRTLIMFPLCYLIGFGSQLLTFHSCGATCILLPLFHPELVLQAIEAYRPTKIYGFPGLYNELVSFPEADRYNLRSLDFCFSAGEAIPVAIQQRFQRIFGVQITEGCGMTELQVYAMNSPYGEKKIGSIGKPIAGMEVSLLDDSDQPIFRTGEIGEMIVRGGSMTRGYWRDPELTARTIREGWFHTGDLAYRDEEEAYWFISRKSEIIRQRGGLVSPIEVEGVLYRHPMVREAAVIGVPEGSGSESVQAHVVPRDSGSAFTAQELIEFAKVYLAEYKVPREIVFEPHLPLGPTGKIDRKSLRERVVFGS
jgi:long-chain acyl-CoA synthetase